MPAREPRSRKQRRHRHAGVPRMCIGNSGRKSERPRHPDQSLHAPFILELPPCLGRVSRTDKFLSDADKTWAGA
jgi:hypothetical protein